MVLYRSIILLTVFLVASSTTVFAQSGQSGLFDSLDKALDMVSTRFPLMVPIALSVYTVLIVTRCLIYTCLFTSLEKIEGCGKKGLDDHLSIVPGSMRSIAQPSAAFAYHASKL